jgi:hypothetical protein
VFHVLFSDRTIGMSEVVTLPSGKDAGEPEQPDSRASEQAREEDWDDVERDLGVESFGWDAYSGMHSLRDAVLWLKRALATREAGRGVDA